MVAKMSESISLFLQYDMNFSCGKKSHSVWIVVQGNKSGLAWLLEGKWKWEEMGRE